MPTLRDWEEAGLDLRLWCYACERVAVMDSILWQRFERKGWSIEAVEARCRFRCKGCGSAADVLLVPARRPPVKAMTWATEVAAFFHVSRHERKRRR